MGAVATLPLTRRQLLGGGALLAGGWVLGQAVGHWPLASEASPFLGSSARHTLQAAFEALLPAEADAATLVEGVDRFLASGDPVLGGQLRLALHVLEHFGGAGPFAFRRFSRLPVARRAAVLGAWQRSAFTPKRQIAAAVRKVAVFTWWSSPASWPSIGYDGPWVSR